MNLGKRQFSKHDQQRFAASSGDYNPMHMDPVLSRRTQAGAPVVHGLHLLLWTLDFVAATQANLPPLRKVRAQFNKFVYLGESAEVVLAQQMPTSMRLHVAVQSAVRTRVHLEFGDTLEQAHGWVDTVLTELARPPFALDMPFSSFPNQVGRLSLQTERGLDTAMFPAATRWLGARAVGALMASTHLVGMVIPGLHSIYSELTVSRCADNPANPALAFRVKDADPRFRTVELEIAGGGFTGAVNAFARTPPVMQATMESILSLVPPNQFAGAVALIVGGSRGLGELTAKIIAAGGGKPIITWQSGRTDAEIVANDIQAAGRSCETLSYDAGRAAAEQVAFLAEPPTHLYYFATPTIFRPQAALFDPKRLRELMAIYVDGFFDLVLELRSRCSSLSAFYPSTAFVSERPAGMLEYAMAKVAGEVLCCEINTSLAPTRVTHVRLPRLPTDQTASVGEVQMADPVATMLPIIQMVQALT